MSGRPEPALRMVGIEKRFGAVAALRGVDLEVRAGEVHALLGENGAGKSTLMKVLSGAHSPDAGQMQLLGRPYAPSHPLQARDRGIAMIYQELTLAPHLTVAENIVLGREPSRLGWVDRQARAARVRSALDWLKQRELAPDRRVAELAPGPRQLVEVARALCGDARLVIMDEPTSSLSLPEAEQLFAVIERLRGRGVAVIYISHFFEEVRRVAHRYTVLRDGRSVDSGSVPPPSAADAGFGERVLSAMAGRPAAASYPRVAHEPGDSVLELDALAGGRLPHAASLVLRRGEIFGIAGLVGAGRTEMLRALFGLDALRSGRVRIGAVWDTGEEPRRRLLQGVGMLSENRKDEGLALGLSIATNITLSRPLTRLSWIAERAQTAVTAQLAHRLGLRYATADQSVAQLSGGNQQKVALARLLHHDVDVLLLDEPTRGVDVSSKAEIYRLIGELAARGKAILMVSSYIPELLGVADRIAVMHRGRLGPARPAAEWDATGLLRAATAGTHA